MVENSSLHTYYFDTYIPKTRSYAGGTGGEKIERCKVNRL